MQIPDYILQAARQAAANCSPDILLLSLADVDTWVVTNMTKDPLPRGVVPVAAVMHHAGVVHILGRASVHDALRDALRPYARVCWPKEQHSSQGAAEAQLRSITRRGLEKDTHRIHTYLCPDCGAWHVGHGGRNARTAPDRAADRVTD